MRKSKVVLIVIIILLVLLLGAGGTFAYLFLATDVFKSDKEMFFNYLSQVYAEENGFIDSNIYKLDDKKKNNPYKNEGDISVNVSVPKEMEESIGDTIKKTNDLKVSFSGNVNNLAKKFEQDIELDYGNDVKLPFKIKFDGDIFGIQNKYISKKYIAVENKNLKELAQKFDADASTISEMPDKIDFDDVTSKITFSKDEVNQMAQNYGNVLNEQLSKDKFSKAKTIDGTEYSLTLNGDETKELLIKLLENVKQDSILKSKFNDYLKEYSSSEEEMDIQSIVQEIIDAVNEIDSSTMKDLKISLNVVNKNISQINIQYGPDVKASFERSVGNDGVSYKNNLNLNINADSSMQINITFNCNYTGLEGLEQVGQKYEIGFEITADGEKIAYNYNINNNIEFTVLNNSESLTESNAIIINDYDAETVQDLMTSIGQRIELVNNRIIEKLELEEKENPILYATPYTMFEQMISSSINSAIEGTNNNLGEMEIKAFNDQFTRYESDNSSYSDLRAMLQSVMVVNNSYTDRSISVYLDGDEIISSSDKEIPEDIELDESKRYKIETNQNAESKIIDEILITTTE